MTDKDVEIDVLCGIPNYPKGKFYEGYSYTKNRHQQHGNIQVSRAFELPRGDNSNARIFLNYISFPISSLFHIPRLLTKKYDKILIYQLSPVMMAIAGIVVGKIKRTETTMYVLDLWPENLFSVLDIKNPFLRNVVTWISHWHYKRVDKLVVLSEKMKDKIVSITKNSSDAIIVLPQACEKIYEEDVSDKELSKRFKGGFNIVFTGNISPAQSFDTLLDASETLKSSGVTDIRWIIVGDGMSRKWLEEQVEARGLQEQFYFEGFKPISDMPKYATVADVLVGALVKSELLEATIPAKVMSYLAAGKPLALAMDGEVSDLINKTIRCGFVSETGDAKQLAINIKKIYSMNEKERTTMGNRGREYHLQHFERNLILGKLYDFIFR